MDVLKSSPLAALLLASITIIIRIDTVESAGFSPGADLFGHLDHLPLPLPNRGRRPRRGRLAETMSEALDELRETRVELTALREEMRSISEQRTVLLASSTTNGAGAGVGAAASPPESSVMSKLKLNHRDDDVKQERRQSYSLGLTPQLR